MAPGLCPCLGPMWKFLHNIFRGGSRISGGAPTPKSRGVKLLFGPNFLKTACTWKSVLGTCPSLGAISFIFMQFSPPGKSRIRHCYLFDLKFAYLRWSYFNVVKLITFRAPSNSGSGNTPSANTPINIFAGNPFANVKLKKTVTNDRSAPRF